MDWFGADKKGLERIARRRGLSYVLFELVQNAWDTAAKEVKVTFNVVEGRPLVDVTVEDDDPDGFKDLTHAWTLFAASEKKGDPEKRGRFNLGEKLVLAICERAEIISTKGNVRFDDEGRHTGRQRTEKGSIFFGRVKMTRAELTEILVSARGLIAPPGVVTIIGQERVQSREILAEFEATLQTEVADEEGFLIRRARKTHVRVYKPLSRNDPDTNKTRAYGWLYEMGIPVCPTGDPWDVEIMQKVPVNLERNSVSKEYLRSVRVFVLNETHRFLKKEDAAQPAIQDALADERVKSEAVETVLKHQYGEKRVVYDPSDREANHRAVAAGYTVIPGGAMTKDAWSNVRRSGAALPSGQVMPTPKPYSSDPNARTREMLPESEWTHGMKCTAAYARALACELLRKEIRITIDKGRMGGCRAAYGGHELTFSFATLGTKWFDKGINEDLDALLLHEFAHEYEENHLADGFHRACTRLGAKLGALGRTTPEFFKTRDWVAGKP